MCGNLTATNTCFDFMILLFLWIISCIRTDFHTRLFGNNWQGCFQSKTSAEKILENISVVVSGFYGWSRTRSVRSFRHWKHRLWSWQSSLHERRRRAGRCERQRPFVHIPTSGRLRDRWVARCERARCETAVEVVVASVTSQIVFWRGLADVTEKERGRRESDGDRCFVADNVKLQDLCGNTVVKL